MHPPHADKILAGLKPSDVVLDIGGWACPFNRANYVMDSEPYESRGFYKTVGLPASQGGEREFFTGATWLVRDICGREPYPFADKSIDFVTCSHVLEDVRDPLWVCSEMVRVAKRGYLEVPSRLAESCRGWESDRIAGLTHHRWLIDVDQDRSDVRFLMKHHMIHSDRRFSLPKSFSRRLAPERHVSWLFWDDSFTFSETMLHGMEAIAAELEGFVARVHRYPAWLLALDRVQSSAQLFANRARGRLRRAGI